MREEMYIKIDCNIISLANTLDARYQESRVLGVDFRQPSTLTTTLKIANLDRAAKSAARRTEFRSGPGVNLFVDF
jgi:hypothetical protein